MSSGCVLLFLRLAVAQSAAYQPPRCGGVSAIEVFGIDPNPPSLRPRQVFPGDPIRLRMVAEWEADAKPVQAVDVVFRDAADDHVAGHATVTLISTGCSPATVNAPPAIAGKINRSVGQTWFEVYAEVSAGLQEGHEYWVTPEVLAPDFGPGCRRPDGAHLRNRATLSAVLSVQSARTRAERGRMKLSEAGFAQVAKQDLREALVLTLAARDDLEGAEAAGVDFHAGYLSSELGDLRGAEAFYERFLASQTGRSQARRSAQDMVETIKQKLANPEPAKEEVEAPW